MTAASLMWEMSKKLAEVTGKSPFAVYWAIKENARHILKNIPPEELLEIFKEDCDEVNEK